MAHSTLVCLNSGMASVKIFLKFPIFRKIDVFRNPNVYGPHVLKSELRFQEKRKCLHYVPKYKMKFSKYTVYYSLHL